MKAFTPDLAERKRIMKNIYTNHPLWKMRAVLIIILIAIAAAVLIGTICLVATNSKEIFTILIFAVVGLCFACIPFFAAIGIYNGARYKYAFPYSSYANGTLFLYDDMLEYIFWKVTNEEPAAYSSKRAVYRDIDKFVYRIKRADVVQLTVENDICTIKGNGITTEPGETREYPNKEVPTSGFSFLMAFEQKDTLKSLKEWRNMPIIAED